MSSGTIWRKERKRKENPLAKKLADRRWTSDQEPTDRAQPPASKTETKIESGFSSAHANDMDAPFFVPSEGLRNPLCAAATGVTSPIFFNSRHAEAIRANKVWRVFFVSQLKLNDVKTFTVPRYEYFVRIS